MRKVTTARALLVATALSQVYSLPVFAADQDQETAIATGDIVVTARRREEDVQDVPLTVDALQSESLQKLNIRNFTDIQSLVPGLTLTAPVTGIAPSATLRGVNFDTNNSGNNATVQFYLNDAPIGAGFLFQSMFDVGQIEVLRGPQGTLRGVAAPSGSITVTTHKPDLGEIGGYVNGTVNTIGGVNINGAVNVPIITDVLGLRVAGIVNDDESSRVHSISSPDFEPSTRSRGERVSLRFEPTDSIKIDAFYQHYLSRQKNYDQVESANLALGLPVVGTEVKPFDRLAVEDRPHVVHQEYNVFNVQAEWGFGPAKLNYVFDWDKQVVDSQYMDDIGNVFGSTYPGSAGADPLTSPNLQNYGQHALSKAKHESHELRLTSVDPLFGVADYVVGGLINRLDSPTNLVFETPVFSSEPPSPANFYAIAQTPFNITNRTLERSLFGNLTVHIGQATELSGGIRYIHYNVKSTFAQGDFKTTIYSASIKHRFNDHIMAYASTGSSWRASVGTNGVILSSAVSTQFTDPNLLANLAIIPETSKSYEVGVKTDWLDRRLRLNVTYYHQDFKNFIFTSSPIVFNGYNGSTYTPTQTRSGLGVGVPAKVNGVEAEVNYAPSRAFNFGATLSYSLGKISNGLVPCNKPTLPAPPAQANFCTVNQRSSPAAPFVASAQSEYTRPINNRFDGFLRGQMSFYGDSQNDPGNPIDNVKSYALINLFAGVRDPDGAWEVTAYAKNIFNTQRVLTRDDIVESTTYATFTGGGAIASNYRGITVTAPREFGITARYAFGSR